MADKRFVVLRHGKRFRTGIVLVTYQSAPWDNCATFPSARPKTSGKRRQEYSSARKLFSPSCSSGIFLSPSMMFSAAPSATTWSLRPEGVSKTPAKSEAFFTWRGLFNSGAEGAGGFVSRRSSTGRRTLSREPAGNRASR